MNLIFWLLIIAVLILWLIALLITFLSVKNVEVDLDAPLIFIHIPKTAGTTIDRIGKKHGYQWRYNEKSNLYNCNCNLWHLPPTQKIKEYQIPTFCVIRNPYERIISEYKFRNSKYSVEGLNKYISKCMDWLDKDPYIYDCHWIPQYQYLTYCDHVLHFEHLQEEFDSLMKKYNLPIVLDLHRNQSKPSEVSVKDISSDNIKRINQYYQHDFEQLKYDLNHG